MIVFVASSLFERGHDVAIVNLNGVPAYVNTHRQNIVNDIHVYDCKLQSKSVKLAVKFLFDVVKKENPDVLIGFTGYPNMDAKIV